MISRFDSPIDRRGTGSFKWSRYGDDVLPMWVADMDFAAAPEIVAAITDRLAHPILGYSVARPELRDQIVSDMASQHGWSISPDDIVFLPGVEPGFNMAIKALLAPGQSLAIQTPVYRPILTAPQHWQLTAIAFGLDAPTTSRSSRMKSIASCCLTVAAISRLLRLIPASASAASR